MEWKTVISVVVLGFCLTSTVNPTSVNELKLELAIVMFRHGHRSPMRSLPAEGHLPADYWPQGFKQLSVRGMQQEYYLGELLKRRYITDHYRGFLNETYSRDEVYVRSTDSDRTLMSAQVLLAALFFPKEETFSSSFPWQPVPVHTVSKEDDSLLIAYGRDCPRYKELKGVDVNTQEYQQKEEENQQFLEIVKDRTGMKEVSLSNIRIIYDTLYSEHASGCPLPEWATLDIMERMKELSEFTQLLMFNSIEKKRLIAGNWIQKVLTDMIEKSKRKNGAKLHLYSAHDASLACMMGSLGVYDGRLPAYASAFILELLSDPLGEFYVQMFYRWNTSTDDIKQLNIPTCGYHAQCSLDQFEQLTMSLTPNDWEAECDLHSDGCPVEPTSDDVMVGVLVCGLSFAISALLVNVVVMLWVCQNHSSYIHYFKIQKTLEGN